MLTFRSPAKINLFLKVLGKRKDGYHSIQTLMQAVDLFDSLHVSFSDKESFHTNHPDIPVDRGNLILRAVDLFRHKTGKSFSVSIELDKQIPVQAGLGGGSSNCATTLFALNSLHNNLVDTKTLMKWGGELGSDVPFFLSSGSALCTGRGESVESQPPFSPKEKLWIIKPTEGLSTSSVYAAFSSKNIDRKHPFYNDLEEPAYRLNPNLLKIKNDLLAQGMEQVLLSGSGTAFFAIGDQKPNIPSCKLFAVQPVCRNKSNWY